MSVEDGNITDRQLIELREQVYGEEAVRPRGISMLDLDPPDHTRLRRLVSKAFTPRAVEALRPRITGLVDEMLDAAERRARARVDLVDALAFPLPFAVIAEMLGMPPADHERIRQLSGTVVRSLEPVNDPDTAAAIAAADAELTQIAAEMIAWKRANPADDLLTALINAEDDGDVLDDDELIAQTLLLYIAGHETTVNLIAGGTLALLRHPDQLALLRANPGLTANAVEELLRYDSPVQATRRVTLEPVYLLRCRRSRPGPSSWPCWARPTGTRATGVLTPPSSGSTGRTRGSTSRSAPGRTTAWGRRWPGWRPRSPSRSWPAGSPGSPSTARSPGTAGSTCADPPGFRCRWGQPVAA